MKRIVLLLLLLTIPTFAQNSKSLLELKQQIEIKETNEIQFQTMNLQKKSAGLAVLYSLLLPGMGELYAGGYSSGKYFTVSEGVIWGVLAGVNIYAKNKEDDYKAFAKANADVDLKNKNEDYFAAIGGYLNQENYNDAKATNRDFESMYEGDEYFWNWANHDERSEYRSLWKSSEEAYNNIRFAVGALILNRVVSAINAARLVARHNNKVDEQLSWNLSMGIKRYKTMPSSMNLNVHFSF